MANHILSCIRRSVAIRSRKGMLPLSTGETTPGVLCLFIGSPVQEIYEASGESPVKRHEDD